MFLAATAALAVSISATVTAMAGTYLMAMPPMVVALSKASTYKGLLMNFPVTRENTGKFHRMLT
jgi:hypothetical protein